MSLSPHIIALICAITFIFSLYLTKFTIIVSRKTGFVNNPNPIVEFHKQPVPYGGGISIGISVILIILFSYGAETGTLKFILSIIPVMAIGMIDDALMLSPLKKFLGEIISLVPLIILLGSSYAFILPFLVMALCFQNAWNLIDIMDGLVAGISVIIFLSLGIITLFDSRLGFYSLIALVTAGAVLGFGFSNKYPAKIFLGDTGSLLLGTIFSFIVIHVILVQGVNAAPLIFLAGVPLFELFFLIIVRTKKHIPFYRGSPDHFALRMLNNGLAVNNINRQVILFSMGYSAIIAFFSIIAGTTIALVLILLFSLSAAVIAFRYFDKLPVRLTKK